MSTLILFILLSTLTVAYGGGNSADQNPFTPKAYVSRYWDRHVRNTLSKPSFLLSKASPLTAADTASFTNLAATNTLSTRLPDFCSAAHLLCFPDVRPSLEKHTKDVNFQFYQDAQNFTNYGTSRPSGTDSFKNYATTFFSRPMNDFRRYSRRSAGHVDRFHNYGNDTNDIYENFNTYGTSAAGGSGEFKHYATRANFPELQFTAYSDRSGGRTQSFSSYSEDGNSGGQNFTSYGKDSAGAGNEFLSYGTKANVAASSFANYGSKGTGSNDTFTNYGVLMNVPEETFQSYADGTVGGSESFSNYRVQANVGDDSFQSYAKNTKEGTQVNFNNYAISANPSSDTFKGYAEGAEGDYKVGFTGYGVNTNATFKDYAKEGVSFASYNTSSSSSSIGGSLVKRWVEPGKFFRESMLKEGSVMAMPDIRDKMPQRSFLPRSILLKLPFSSSKIEELKSVFKVSDNSSMEKMMMDSLGECERAPSVGEIKRCVGSVEDMIDFATSVLGHNVGVWTTQNVNGFSKNVMVGRVKGMNGGKVTKSVSCHQSLFPYLLYYCHSVPKVRVYEADLLDPESKAKINQGVAICHLDTTAWSPTHGAFVALGSGPGKIEVCHWIFENDMTWTIAD
ncbi:polygalacturonase 1 beta-like protein 3 [Vigna unguiculata]|uniref:polygalacturonase 1 beta-like protein 3 n=1 Tax=Vigna unguiculata TaxID=3917 RepID=UPI001016A8BB|nr:polygalacturonase 1 beta-like protein 3 [Vigna unguiculata]